jgi:uncharacterized protein (TIGR03435 family)
MKHRNKNSVLQRFFEQLGTAVPSEGPACDRVLQRLQNEPVTIEHRFARSSPQLPWPAFALAVVAVVVAVLVPARVLRSAPAVLEDGSGSRSIHYGDVVRGGTLKFADGSRVEVRPESELSLESTNEGPRVKLEKGDVLVSAAKQLVIHTRDMSAVGKVFVVNTKEEGSRVAAFGGETKVQQGTMETTLKPGDQTATNPTMQPQLLSLQVAWSREAQSMLALLQQPPAPRLAFEVASVRLSANAPPTGERGGGGGVRRRNPRPAGEPCGSGGEPVIDPRNFSASETTIHAVITWAYGLDCKIWRGSDHLLGGPDWLKEDGYDIQAVIPQGTPQYSKFQVKNNQASELQKMLQTLLAERFKLVIHRETREMPVYVLSVAKGGPRIIPSPLGKKADVNMITTANGQVVRAPGSAPPRPPGLSIWKDGDDDCCETTSPEGISGTKKAIAYLAGQLALTVGRPVLDRTGLTGEFNYNFIFEPTYSPGLPGPSGPRPAYLPPADTRSISKALEQDLGLKLESTREKIDVFVIDRIERPTEN